MFEEPVRARVRRALKRVFVAIWFRGDRVICPLCNGRFSRFRDSHGRPAAKCPQCGVLERHRLLWLFLDREVIAPRVGLRVLHIAPEPSLARRLQNRVSTYVSFDLESPIADVHGDLTRAPFGSSCFDLIVCSHVLEHVVDDSGAAREIRRMLAPDGVAVVLVPVHHDRADTYEDPDVVTPDDRLRVFGQSDHVRIYGRDFTERLRDAGLSVEEVDYREALGEETVRYGATASETLYVCRTDR